MDNGNLPASPSNINIYEYEGIINCPVNSPLTGLTKREAFAMAALQGIIASDIDNIYTSEYVAVESVAKADALLKELSK